MRQHQLDCQLAYSWPQKPQVEANEAYITTRVNIKLNLDQLICSLYDIERINDWIHPIRFNGANTVLRFRFNVSIDGNHELHR